MHKRLIDRALPTIIAGFLLAGCASVGVRNVLPERVTRSFESIDREEAVALQFTPIPDGEELKIAVGPMQYSLNSVFMGMVEEMLIKKFGELDKASENRLHVRIEYLNPQYETLGGTMNRLDMTVSVSVHDGAQTTERDLSLSQQTEYDGYPLRSDEIQWLLTRFTIAIDDMIDEQYATRPTNRK